MADQIMTAGTQLATLVKTFWSPKFYDTRRAELIFQSSVDDSYQGDIQDMGNAVKINTVPDFTEADTLPEGAKGDADAVTTTAQTLTINQRPYKDVIIESIAKLQSLEFMNKLRDAMIYAILKRIDSIVLAAMVPSASSPDHQIAYDTGTTLALADIQEAKELLDTADVAQGNRIMALGAAQMNDLFNIGEFISKDFNTGNSPMTNGNFSNSLFLGFQGKFSTRCANVARFFHPSMITMAFQKLLNASLSNGDWEGKRAFRINMDVLMGVKQLDSSRGVSVS